MKIEKNGTTLRIWLDDEYAIRKIKDSRIYCLEWYKFGKDHMPDELWYEADLYKLYEKYEDKIGK